MYALLGSNTRIIKDIWCGKAVCPRCHHESNRFLTKVKTIVSVLWLPIFSKTEKYLMLCDDCRVGVEMTREDYNVQLKQREGELLHGGFPADVVLRTCGPKAQAMSSKGMLLGACILLMLMMAAGMAALINDSGFADLKIIIGVLFMAIIGILPLIFAARIWWLAYRRVSVYKKVKTAYDASKKA